MSLPPFQQFLDAHRREVLRFLRALVGPDEADDCFQETFIAALRAYPTIRDAASLRSWVLTIAHRKALDAHRARGRADGVATAGAMLAAEPRLTRPTDDERACARQGELWERIRGLPDKQRAAIFLRFVADLPYREIATALDCSEAAARRSAHDGLARLREHLDREEALR